MRERSCGDPLARYLRRCPALLSGRSHTDRLFSSTHRRRIRVIGQVDRAPQKWYASAALLSAFKCAGISSWKNWRDTATLFERRENTSAGIVSTGCRWISFVPAIETIESRAQLISESFSSIHNWRQVRKRDARPQSRVDTDTDRIRAAAQLAEAIQCRFFLRLPLQHADGEGLAIETRQSGLHRQSRSLRRHSRLSPQAGWSASNPRSRRARQGRAACRLWRLATTDLATTGRLDTE